MLGLCFLVGGVALLQSARDLEKGQLRTVLTLGAVMLMVIGALVLASTGGNLSFFGE
jgi:uncharacterized membrane protein YjjP (DUF1212 family)